MNFKKKIDIRVALAKVDFTLTLVIFITILFSFRDKTFSPFSSLLLSVLPFDFFSKQKICLLNSYFFLNYKGKEPSPTTDIPIKAQHIECYSMNNPFPTLNRLCNSGKNITLFLKNNKKIIFSVKDQELFIVNWLKENFIRKEDKVFIMGRIETAGFTMVSLLEVLFFINLYKSGNIPEHGMPYFIVASACFVYWLLYIISGILIQREGNNDED